LLPGDAIYIPFHWWHHVESLTAVNVLVNYWWAESTSLQMPGTLSVGLLAMLTMRSLPPQQRRAFAAMIRHYVLCEGGDTGSYIPAQARGILGSPGVREIRGFFRMLRDALRDPDQP